ncbi:MAG TPA: hypothetical protein VGL38_01140 [bacterium]|jgi:hypothetical protein
MKATKPKQKKASAPKTQVPPTDSEGGDDLLKGDLGGMGLAEVIAEANLSQSPEEVGQTMYRWFADNGGLAFDVADEGLQLSWKGRVLQIGKDSFKSFLLEEAGITTRTPKAGRIIEAFRLKAIANAKRADHRSWFKTDRAARVVYLHLNAADQQIFRISPAKIERIENGANSYDVLLFPSPKIAPWGYQALNAAGFKKAVLAFDELVLSRLACTPENRLLYGCWLLAYPLMGFTSSRPHLRCEGSSGRGKTRAMDIMSTFLYGDSKIKTATEAANYTDASQNPLVLIDNIETKNLTPALVQFILTAVSGIERERRAPGAARSMIVEELHCLLNTSGIENLDRIELLNRTFHIEFDSKKFGMPLWSDTYYHVIRINRSTMMSAHIQIIAKVLDAISQDKQKAWRQWLQEKHPGHILERSNEYLAIMALVADVILPIIDPKAKVKDLVDKWITGQDAYVGAVAVEASPIVATLDAIFREAALHRASPDVGKWPYELPCDGNSLSGASSPLRAMLAKVAAKYRLDFDYKSPNTFSKRLKDSEATLDSAGYTLDTGYDGNKKHFTFTITKKGKVIPKGIWGASTLSDVPDKPRRKR